MGIDYVKEFYRLHLKKYGKEDIRAMGWHDEEEYSVRFEVVTGVADLEDSSILDVGCGFGGLYNYLKSSDLRHFSYLGIDILPEMIDLAQKKNPTGRFRVADILHDDVGQYDYVFCIGALNITTQDFDEYFKEMVDKMINIANKAVVLTFLSDRERLAAGPYHFEDPKSLKQKMMKRYGVKVKIIDDPRLPGESSLFIYKS